MVKRVKPAENKADSGQVPRVLLAGLNAWFCAAGYPWFFLEASDPFLTALHFLPLAVLGLGTLALVVDKTPDFLRQNASTALIASFPVSVAGAVIARERATQALALPGLTLLWCVLSLWVFVGVLTEDPWPVPSQQLLPARARSSQRPWLTALVIAGALLIAIIAPTWNLPPNELRAWTDADVSNALLTAAVGTALGLGALLTVVGPSAIKARKATQVGWPRRVLPPLLLAALSCGTYLLIGR